MVNNPTIFERVAEFFFQVAVRRERQRAAIYARLALTSWDRHRKGLDPHGPSDMREAAVAVVEWYDGKPEHLSLIARNTLLELEGQIDSSQYIDISGDPQGNPKKDL